MTAAQLVRAWKDEDYRLGLDPADRPEHPSGMPESEVYLGFGAELPSSCEGVGSCAQTFCSW